MCFVFSQSNSFFLTEAPSSVLLWFNTSFSNLPSVTVKYSISANVSLFIVITLLTDQSGQALICTERAVNDTLQRFPAEIQNCSEDTDWVLFLCFTHDCKNVVWISPGEDPPPPDLFVAQLAYIFIHAEHSVFVSLQHLMVEVSTQS